MFEFDAMQIASIAGALAVYALAVPMPGPSFVLITRSAAHEGREAGMFSALGTTLAAAAYAVGAILGMGAILSIVPWLLDAIQVLGGAYLLYLGTRLLIAYGRAKGSPPMSPTTIGSAKSPESSRPGIVWKAFLVAASNPKMAVFFLGLFAPAAGLHAGQNAQFVILAGIIVIDFCYHQALANLVATASRSNIVSGTYKWFDAAAGSAMSAFGIGLIMQTILRARQS